MVDRYAGQLVAMAEEAGRNGATISPDFVQGFGSAFKDSIAAGRTPALAIRVAYHLEKNGHADAASTLLDQDRPGVKQQVKQAGETGKTFHIRRAVPEPGRLGRQRRPAEAGRAAGPAGRQRPLVDKVRPSRRPAGADPRRPRERPRELLDGLPGGGTLDEAYNTLVKRPTPTAATST